MISILDEMDERCKSCKVNMDVSGGDFAGVFGKKEAAEVKRQWSEVQAACTAWLDVLNAQGILPILLAVVE